MAVMKTILCTMDQKEEILRQMLKESGQKAVTDVRTVTLSSLWKQEDQEETAFLLLKIMQVLKKSSDHYPIYRDMFQYPVFLQEILSFAEKVCLWKIPADALPRRTDSEKELAEILTQVTAMDLPEKKMADQEDEVLKETLQLPDLTVWPSFETSYFQYVFLQKLKQAGVRSHACTDHHPNTELHHALNPRQEMESCVQDICRRNQSSLIILCDYENQYPVAEQIFRRYQIPFSSISDTAPSRAAQAYASLVGYALHKDADSLYDAIQKDAFPVSCSPYLLQYLKECMLKPEMPEPVSEQIAAGPFGDSAGDLTEREQEADRWFKENREDLKTLKDTHTAMDAFMASWKILQKLPMTADPAELKASMKIRSILQQSLSSVHTEEDAEFLLKIIGQLSIHSCVQESDFCRITDLHHPLESADNVYLLGCDGSSYPGFPGEKGLFDEDYVQNIPQYPSLRNRHDAYMDQLKWIDHAADRNLFYSWHTNDYQGREVQLAYEAELLFQGKPKSTKWQLDVLPPAPEKAHRLSPVSAEALFTENRKIHGSISSIEAWFQCPYVYFIQSGLHVRDRNLPDIDNSSIGTVQHAWMEHAVKTQGKNYADLSEDQILSFLKPFFDALDLLHPRDVFLHACTMQRMADGLQTALIFLKEMEASSSYVPFETEHRFEAPIADSVVLNGIIDRMDKEGSRLRVIDYKSSRKGLSEAAVKAGLQLQLLSYIIISQQLCPDTQPSAAWYFSLKEEKFSEPASILSAGRGKKAGTVDDQDADSEPILKEAFMKQRHLRGWSFIKMENEQDKRYFSPYTSVYSYDLCRQCIQDLYDYFSTHLLAGEISPSPAENACTYCHFHSVCRYHGDARETVPLACKDISLKEPKNS